MHHKVLLGLPVDFLFQAIPSSNVIVTFESGLVVSGADLDYSYYGLSRSQIFRYSIFYFFWLSLLDKKGTGQTKSSFELAAGELYGSSGAKKAGAVVGFETVKRYPMREENLRLILAGAVVHDVRGA